MKQDFLRFHELSVRNKYQEQMTGLNMVFLKKKVICSATWIIQEGAWLKSSTGTAALWAAGSLMRKECRATVRKFFFKGKKFTMWTAMSGL